MRKKEALPRPAALERARESFEEWRRTRTKRRPIPEPLWNSAVKLAQEYGLHKTSKALRVNYDHLKKRVSAAGTGDSPDCSSHPTFVEVVPPQSTSECIVELEGPRRVKMRIHLKGATAPDLVALGRIFWGSES